jgi:hypothetical protein
MLARHFPHIHPNSAKVVDNINFFLTAPAKQAEDSAWEARLHSPPERQPQPAVAHMTKRAGAKMRPRHLRLAFVVLVDQALNVML